MLRQHTNGGESGYDCQAIILLSPVLHFFYHTFTLFINDSPVLEVCLTFINVVFNSQAAAF